ncbi:hypothetical protein [Arthrobacter sp. NEB 688]|uniref:hypothetical protein n=1 Tax=Arthrobacter sp. NEB 688 TaxID=904039 RepID=UPI0015638C54|nr:hypothetical protein [Arthrobacter sp. NEB 688]QKE82513.1 hypothetical protein HL663_00090 [Arthrobacter sp. NEB 688]
MGTLTGLSVIATTLLWTSLVLGVVVVGLTLAVVLPALGRTREDRKERHLSIPRYYGVAAAH